MTSTVGFYNVGVGVTESHEFLLDKTKFERGESVVLNTEVRVGGVRDGNALNNAKQSVLVVAP